MTDSTHRSLAALALVLACCQARETQIEQPDPRPRPALDEPDEARDQDRDPPAAAFEADACPSALDPSAPTRSSGDDSVPLTPEDEARVPHLQVRFDDWPRHDESPAGGGPEWLHYCGEITALAPQLELRVAGEAQPVQLPLSFESAATGTLALGDAVVVHAQLQIIQIHQVVDVMITDAAGHLLLASAADGTERFAPDWSIERGPPDKPYPRHRGANKPAQMRTHGLIFEHHGARAPTEPNVARKLVSDDGTWVVSGAATGWTKGLLPPDSASYSQFWIARIE